MSIPTIIKGSIWKKDLAKADHLDPIHECLLATALKRAGHSVDSCGHVFVYVNGHRYVTDADTNKIIHGWCAKAIKPEDLPHSYTLTHFLALSDDCIH